MHCKDTILRTQNNWPFLNLSRTQVNECYLLLQRTNNEKSEIVANTPVDMQQPLYLQIQAEGDKYTFNYSTDGHSFKNLGGIVSGDILSPVVELK